MIFDSSRRIEKTFTDNDESMGNIYLKRESVETNLIDYMKLNLKKRLINNKEEYIVVVLHTANNGDVHSFVRLALTENGYALCNFSPIIRRYCLSPGDYVEFDPTFGEIEETITLRFKFYYSCQENENEKEKEKEQGKKKGKCMDKVSELPLNMSDSKVELDSERLDGDLNRRRRLSESDMLI
ncbi:hypothetical protein QVD17_17102 [Tagetes erecta]|uniref:Uncharacterized protein n=1 Tax=Tagetes erecta TaxID=13708 RepID=A0AAD8KSH7_TARER|nr:hypothetical protein QVD17_17102 [Tagetes erecta]